MRRGSEAREPTFNTDQELWWSLRQDGDGLPRHIVGECEDGEWLFFMSASAHILHCYKSWYLQREMQVPTDKLTVWATVHMDRSLVRGQLLQTSGRTFYWKAKVGKSMGNVLLLPQPVAIWLHKDRWQWNGSADSSICLKGSCVLTTTGQRDPSWDCALFLLPCVVTALLYSIGLWLNHQCISFLICQSGIIFSTRPLKWGETKESGIPHAGEIPYSEGRSLALKFGG